MAADKTQLRCFPLSPEDGKFKGRLTGLVDQRRVGTTAQKAADRLTVSMPCSEHQSGPTSVVPEVCGGDKPYLHPDLLNAENLRCRKEALELFNSARKMGGDEFSKVYAAQLEEEMEAAYDNLLKHNIAKNVYTGVQTPMIIFTTILAFYILATLMGMLGLESLANILNLLMLALLGVLGAWVYTRATGNYPEVGKAIDLAATTLHQLVRPGSASPVPQVADDTKKNQ